jgi:hypothetical protein
MTVSSKLHDSTAENHCVWKTGLPDLYHVREILARLMKTLVIIRIQEIAWPFENTPDVQLMLRSDRKITVTT